MVEQRGFGALARIRSSLPSLLPSEQRVAEVLLSRTDEIIGWSVADLAAAASTSTATAVRACQRAGFRGFQQLRLQVAREADPAGQPVRPDFGPGDSPETVAAAVFATVAGVVGDAMCALDRAALGRAADLLARARRILFVGNGESSFPAQAAAVRFTSAGCAVEAPFDAIVQQMAARTLTAEDVCVAVSYSGTNNVTRQAAEASRTAGAAVVAVTAFSPSPLSALADLTLVAGVAPVAPEHDVAAGPIAQFSLLVALQLTTQFRRAAGATLNASGHGSAAEET
ncbi:MAG TPA: MurR/RpiR family transcriptional regulator [Amycolatopsis sp.]|nr:MurR/RpiR family transcriptional regulator [Amycolatopsis sp.]